MRTLIILCAVLMLAGCDRRGIEASETMTEKGTVVTLLHTASHRESHSDLNVGMDFNGNLTITPTTTRINIPETWGVVFDCEHGNRFAIQGSSAYYKELWSRMTPGKPVTIYYREEYEVVRDGDGKEKSRKFHDFDFLDAKHE